MRSKNRKRGGRSAASEDGLDHSDLGSRRGRANIGASAPNGVQAHPGEAWAQIRRLQLTIPEDEPAVLVF